MNNESGPAWPFIDAIANSYAALNARLKERRWEGCVRLCNELSRPPFQGVLGEKPYDIATLRAAPVRPSQNLGMGWWEYVPDNSLFVQAIKQQYAALNARRADEYETQLVPLSSPPKHRMLELGEVIQKGDELRYNSGEGWRPCVGSVGADIDPEDLGDFRRPIPAPKYRAVRPGERIKEGDEWRLFEGNSWKPVKASVGDPLPETSVGNFRRPI